MVLRKVRGGKGGSRVTSWKETSIDPVRSDGLGPIW